jgi:hypothetical protein
MQQRNLAGYMVSLQHYVLVETTVEKMSGDIDIISVNNTHQALLRWESVKRVLEKPVERSIGENKQ